MPCPPQAALSESPSVDSSTHPGDPARLAVRARPDMVFLAFAFSALVGVAFGLYPARKAAQLDPDRSTSVRVSSMRAPYRRRIDANTCAHAALASRPSVRHSGSGSSTCAGKYAEIDSQEGRDRKQHQGRRCPLQQRTLLSAVARCKSACSPNTPKCELSSPRSTGFRYGRGQGLEARRCSVSGGTSYRMLASTSDHEDAVLRPIIRRIDAWRPTSRADATRPRHPARNPGSSDRRARRADRLWVRRCNQCVGKSLHDMKREEHELLHPDLWRRHARLSSFGGHDGSELCVRNIMSKNVKTVEAQRSLASPRTM